MEVVVEVVVVDIQGARGGGGDWVGYSLLEVVVEVVPVVKKGWVS